MHPEEMFSEDEGEELEIKLLRHSAPPTAVPASNAGTVTKVPEAADAFAYAAMSVPEAALPAPEPTIQVAPAPHTDVTVPDTREETAVPASYVPVVEQVPLTTTPSQIIYSEIRD